MARKGENIYKRKDGRWEARYIPSHDEQGHAKYRSVYARSYTEARKNALLRLSEMDYEHQSKAGTVASVANAWLEISLVLFSQFISGSIFTRKP